MKNAIFYANVEAAKSTNKFSGNQHTKTNPDAMINKGRGPTGGGTAMPHCGCDTFTGKAQVRTPGGTTAMPNRGKESFDYGRGPTKGNA
jgi:hypothetical protein